MRLSEVEVGFTSTVKAVETHDGMNGTRRRLLELGFLEGNRVSVVGRSPIGGGIIVELLGGRIALAAAVAKLVILRESV